MRPFRAPGTATVAAVFVALLAAAAAPAVAAPAAVPAVAAPASASALRWHDRLEPALAAAEAGDKSVLVDLYAEWCGWCKKLDREVFSTPEFAEVARDFVLLRVDVEDGGEGRWLQERLGVTGLPTMAIVDPRLVEVGLVEGYHPAGVFVGMIRREVVAHEARLGRERELAKSEDRKVLTRLAADLRGRGDGAAAAPIYRRLLADGGLETAQRAWLEVYLAESLRLARDYAAAGKALSAAQVTASRAAAETRPAVEDAIDVATVRLARDRGGCQAVDSLEALLAERPASKQSPRARRDLAGLRSEGLDC